MISPGATAVNRAPGDSPAGAPQRTIAISVGTDPARGAQELPHPRRLTAPVRVRRRRDRHRGIEPALRELGHGRERPTCACRVRAPHVADQRPYGRWRDPGRERVEGGSEEPHVLPDGPNQLASRANTLEELVHRDRDAGRRDTLGESLDDLVEEPLFRQPFGASRLDRASDPRTRGTQPSVGEGILRRRRGGPEAGDESEESWGETDHVYIIRTKVKRGWIRLASGQMSRKAQTATKPSNTIAPFAASHPKTAHEA